MAAASLVPASTIESAASKEVSLQSYFQQTSTSNASSVLRRAFSSDITSFSSIMSPSTNLTTSSKGVTSVINRYPASHASNATGVTAAMSPTHKKESNQPPSHQQAPHRDDGGSGGGSGASVLKIAADSSDATSGNVHYVTDGDQIYATHGASLGHFAQYVAAPDQNAAYNSFHHPSQPHPQKTGVSSYETESSYATQHVSDQQHQSQQSMPNLGMPRLIHMNQQSTAGFTGLQGQLVTHQGNTYILQTNPGDIMESDGVPFHHVTRASPVCQY